MAAVTQGDSERSALPPAPTGIPKARPFDQGDLGHLAHLTIKASSWLRDRKKDEAHEVAVLVDAELNVPPDATEASGEEMVGWIVDPVLKELLRILERSCVKPYVVRNGREFFLMVRRRDEP